MERPAAAADLLLCDFLRFRLLSPASHHLVFPSSKTQSPYTLTYTHILTAGKERQKKSPASYKRMLARSRSCVSAAQAADAAAAAAEPTHALILLFEEREKKKKNYPFQPGSVKTGCFSVLLGTAQEKERKKIGSSAPLSTLTTGTTVPVAVPAAWLRHHHYHHHSNYSGPHLY